MRVIGTAGHVDHGKSTLIAALTGIHPDRLKEEQEREMTIDLGFAWLDLPNGQEVGIVDVPGHRDFIENMLSGIGGIDAALLVIAADEGVMPQTREHLAILDLLQIQAGLVALTKVDLVEDADWLALVENDIREILRQTSFSNAPIMRVSSRTRAGFPELLQALGRILDEQPPRPDLGRPRLPVDRVFSISGFGTVVTGTLGDGQLSAGDDVVILPSGRSGRIRGLQTHKKKEQTAQPGSRTAVNISGLDVGQIRRGEVVTRPGCYQPTQRLDLSFRLLPDASAPLRHADEVKLFIGAAETIADVRLLGTETLEPGQEGWLQLDLRHPLVAVRGDRYILRRPSPGETLGGGKVVDPQPGKRHRRFDATVLENLRSLLAGSPADVLLQASIALGPALVKDVIVRSRLEPGAAAAALKELAASGQVVALEDLLVSGQRWAALRNQATEALTAFHQAYPLRRGMPREELKSRLKLQPRLFNLAIQRLAAANLLADNPKWICLPGHVVRFTPFQQVKVDKLLARFRATPAAPPSVKECQAETDEDIYSALLEAGDLVQVSGEVVFEREAFEKMAGLVRQSLQEKGQLTLAEVRDLLGASRKYVQALLEHLDASGMTVRDGDFRRLK